MSLLIKMGIFSETLARFYIAELTCAVESVHKMGFIHRYDFLNSFFVHMIALKQGKLVHTTGISSRIIY